MAGFGIVFQWFCVIQFFYVETRQLDNPLILRDTQIYIMMNEGELKGYYPRWNTASFMLKPNQPLSFEDIKFEWREENV